MRWCQCDALAVVSGLRCDVSGSHALTRRRSAPAGERRACFCSGHCYGPAQIHALPSLVSLLQPTIHTPSSLATTAWRPPPPLS